MTRTRQSAGFSKLHKKLKEVGITYLSVEGNDNSVTLGVGLPD